MKAPYDFPRNGSFASLAEAQPQVAVYKNMTGDTYYQGRSAVEFQEHYEISENLASQLIANCRSGLHTKCALLLEPKILNWLPPQLPNTPWEPLRLHIGTFKRIRKFCQASSNEDS